MITHQSTLDPTGLVETLQIPRPHLDTPQHPSSVFILVRTVRSQDGDGLVDPVGVGYPRPAGLVEGFGDVVAGRRWGEVEDGRKGAAEGEQVGSGGNGRHRRCLLCDD